MPVNYTGNHELLEHARNAVISALEQYSSHEDLIDIDAQEKLEALAYAFSECVLLAMDTDDQGKAQANFTISTATQLAYLDSITPDEED
jgi:hypothetical protein